MVWMMAPLEFHPQGIKDSIAATEKQFAKLTEVDEVSDGFLFRMR